MIYSYRRRPSVFRRIFEKLKSFIAKSDDFQTKNPKKTRRLRGPLNFWWHDYSGRILGSVEFRRPRDSMDFEEIRPRAAARIFAMPEVKIYFGNSRKGLGRKKPRKNFRKKFFFDVQKSAPAYDGNTFTVDDFT